MISIDFMYLDQFLGSHFASLNGIPKIIEFLEFHYTCQIMTFKHPEMIIFGSVDHMNLKDDKMEILRWGGDGGVALY